ncbi:hypothetical protein QJQ45_015886 [Haematococcus lacustris]|nr:hypothetical protein QJQ45_015886 [Haematococcus lacustris]
MADPGNDASTGPNDIPHLPRKRAQGPRFDVLPEFRDAAVPVPVQPTTLYPTEPTARLAEVKEPRAGPAFVKYTVQQDEHNHDGTARQHALHTQPDKPDVRHGLQNNRAAWEQTFRQRVVIMSPLIAMYITGSGLVPLPFRASLEKMLHRPAISLTDVDKAQRALAKERKEQEAARQEALSAHRADMHVSAPDRS